MKFLLMSIQSIQKSAKLTIISLVLANTNVENMVSVKNSIPGEQDQ